MPLPVLIAIAGHREAPLVAALGGQGSAVSVVRRCADVSDAVAAAEAGLAEAAVVSADLGMLDRETVGRLQRCGLAVIGLAAAGSETGGADTGAHRLRQLGVDALLDPDLPPDRLVDRLVEAVREAIAGRAATLLPTGPGASSRLTSDPAGTLPLRPAPPAPRRRGPGPVAGSGPHPDGRLIAVWGPVGAPGRTSVAVGLAASLAVHGSVLLVDADTHGASVAQALGLLDESAGLAAAARVANQGRLDRRELQRLAPAVVGELRVLTGLPQPKRWPELRPAALEEVWQQARGVAAWTVVDTGFGLEADEELMFDVAAPRRHAATLSALAAADLVLAVGAAEPVGLQRLLAALPDLADAVPPGVPVQVVLTRVRESAVGRPAEDLVRGALDRFAGVRDAVLLPDEREVHDAAMLAGRSVAEHAPQSRTALGLGELATDLMARLGAAPAATPGTAPRPGRRTGRFRR